MLEGAEALCPDLADTSAAYEHFLDGDGKARPLSYERYSAILKNSEKDYAQTVSSSLTYETPLTARLSSEEYAK